MKAGEYQAWMDDADCATVDPELFFPEKGENHGAARFICSGCPVLTECLTYAMADPSLYGVWGGTTWRERQDIRRRNRSAVAA